MTNSDWICILTLVRSNQPIGPHDILHGLTPQFAFVHVTVSQPSAPICMDVVNP